MAKKSAKQTLFDLLKSVAEIEFLGEYYRTKQFEGWWRHSVRVKYKNHDCLYEVHFTPDEPARPLYAMRHDRSATLPNYYESYFGENRFNQFYRGQADGFVQWVKDTWDSTSMSVRPDSFDGLTGGSSIGFDPAENILVQPNFNMASIDKCLPFSYITERILHTEIVMPYAFERKLIPQSLDRRRKLSDAQKDEIASRYKAGGVSMSKLAVEYGVSKKLILLIVNPDAMERNKKHIAEHWRDYYDTAKNTATRREFRANKKELEARGQLLNAADVPGVQDGHIADIQAKEQEMAIPNYLKDVPIRCPRQDKVREVANILIHLQRYGASNARVDAISTKRGNEICATTFIGLTELDDFTAKKSRAKLVEAAADICGNRKGIIRLNVASGTSNKVYTVDFPPVTGRPPKTDK